MTDLKLHERKLTLSSSLKVCLPATNVGVRPPITDSAYISRHLLEVENARRLRKDASKVVFEPHTGKALGGPWFAQLEHTLLVIVETDARAMSREHAAR